MQLLPILRRKVIYPIWVRKNRDLRFEYFKKYEKMQFSTEDELKTYQLSQLKEILVHAYRNTEYYNKAFKEINFDPENFNDFNQMLKIPILTKAEIQSSSDQLIAGNFSKDAMIKFKTGGSTGKSLTIYSNRDRLERGIGASLLCFGWAGHKLGEPTARVWGNPPVPATLKEKIKKYLLEPIIWLDTMDLNEKSMLTFIKEWKKEKPTLLHGHAHSLYIFAKFLKEYNISYLKPKGIISTSMMLIDSERSLIEEVFGVNVTNLYGCEEVGLIACECNSHDGMHLNLFNNYIEFIKNDGTPAAPGEEGAIVVTSLSNYGMPIIRYRIEDMGIPIAEACSCGISLPMIRKVTGRVADFLVKPGGGLVAGISLIERTLTKIKGIEQLQIIQKELELIHVNLVKNTLYTNQTNEALKYELQRVFGSQVIIKIELVDKIKIEKSGKYRFSICEVDY